MFFGFLRDLGEGFFGLPYCIFARRHNLHICPFTLFGHNFSVSKEAFLVLIAFLSMMFIYAVFLLRLPKSFLISRRHFLCCSSMVPSSGPNAVQWFNSALLNTVLINILTFVYFPFVKFNSSKWTLLISLGFFFFCFSQSCKCCKSKQLVVTTTKWLFHGNSDCTLMLFLHEVLCNLLQLAGFWAGGLH